MQELVNEILFESFYKNKSVNFVIKQDHKKDIRLRTLIKYSMFKGSNFGKIYLAENQKACAIVIDPLKEKITLKGVLWDVKLAFSVIGLGNVLKVMRRERILKKYHPKTPFMHLWYIGVNKEDQGKGFGSKLLKEIIADNSGRDIYLETSTERNFSFYKRNGFELVDDLVKELGYHLNLYVRMSTNK